MSLEIVVGPMFSGKSSYALSYVRRQRVIDKKVLVMKPDIDNRYSDKSILITHNQETLPCKIWRTDFPLTLIDEMRESDCIVFEEAQFFKNLTNTIIYLLRAYKKDVLIVGLDGDALQKPFGEILDCIPWASKITKLNALCSKCKDGTLAPYTKRISNNPNQIDVGAEDKYVSVCLKHLTC